MALFWMLFGITVTLVFGWLLKDSDDSGDTTPTRKRL
jgi:hypothetical protein